MPLGNHFGYIDGEKFWFTSIAGRCGDCVGGNLAAQRTNCHEGIYRRIARHFADLICAELNDLDLFGSDAGFRKNDVEQRYIGLRSYAHANAVSREICQALDFGSWTFSGSLDRQTRGSP